jgi:hypothetical protein
VLAVAAVVVVLVVVFVVVAVVFVVLVVFFAVLVVFVEVLVDVEVEIVVVGTVDDVVEAGGMQNERSNHKWFSGR